jgi:hypothetical protein
MEYAETVTGMGIVCDFHFSHMWTFCTVLSTYVMLCAYGSSFQNLISNNLSECPETPVYVSVMYTMLGIVRQVRFHRHDDGDIMHI